MNFAIKLTIILIILGIITSLSWSEWFWLIIILFPVVILIRTRKRINITYSIIVLVIFFVLWLGLIADWIISTGDIIVLLYLGLIFFVLWVLFWIKKPTWSDESPISVFWVFTSLAAILWTIFISTMMPAPLPIAPTNTNIPKINTGSTVATGIISTGITSKWLSYPLIIQ